MDATITDSSQDLIKKHGTAKSALKFLMESGRYKHGAQMLTLQQLQILAYAEDNGWKVKS